MFDAIVVWFQSFFREPSQQEMLIPVRVEEKRDVLKRR